MNPQQNYEEVLCVAGQVCRHMLTTAKSQKMSTHGTFALVEQCHYQSFGDAILRRLGFWVTAIRSQRIGERRCMCMIAFGISP
eukprot:6226117-Amphidinium_carterae.1